MKDIFEIAHTLREDAAAGALDARPVADFPRCPDPDDVATLEHLIAGLADRTAMRFLTDDPVAQTLFPALARAMEAVDRALWPDLHVHLPLEYILVARNVEGIQPGVFSFSSAGLRTLVAEIDTSRLADMVLQPEFADAPALVLVAGSLEKSLATHNSHGHRLLLERSGAACEAAWLEAVRRGYGGSIFAGFLPSALKELLSVDGYARTQLLAMALGHPHTEWTSPPSGPSV